MFLKLVKKKSIATQLTISYSLATLFLITVIALVAYWVIVDTLSKANHQFLSDEISIIKHILNKKPGNSAALQQEVIDIPQALANSVYHYYIRILDNQQNIIIATPNSNQTIPIAETKDQKIIEHSPYLLLQTTVNTDPKNTPWTIQAILDMSYQKHLIRYYQHIIFLVLIIGTVLSIFLGLIISKRGMRRLDQLTALTKDITAHTLRQRINPKDWPQELHELANAYNQMLDRINASMTKLTQFSDDLAHELRIPLTNLMGEAEGALTQPGSVTDYRVLIESHLEELNRLSKIIENLLFLARAEDPQIDLQKIPFHVEHEIKKIYQFYQAIAEEKAITLSCIGDATLSANVIMFQRMIGNLLSNALKYATSQSEISITIETTKTKMVRITLVDHGEGIAAEHLNKLFDRFYRTDTSRANDSGGSGLGLAIVKSIVDLHHGSISISSEVNQGTIIIVDLPQ